VSARDEVPERGGVTERDEVPKRGGVPERDGVLERDDVPRRDEAPCAEATGLIAAEEAGTGEDEAAARDDADGRTEGSDDDACVFAVLGLLRLSGRGESSSSILVVIQEGRKANRIVTKKKAREETTGRCVEEEK
jgi:hypothetical protein